MSFDLFGTASLPFELGSETSQEAAESMRASANTLRLTVLREIQASPNGLTDEEIQQRLKMNPNTERPRRIELVIAGAVRPSTRKRPTASGRLATVWEVAA